MKLINLLALLAILTGCGLQGQINELKNKANQADAEAAEQGRINEEARLRMDLLQRQIDELQLDVSNIRNDLISIDSAIAATNSSLASQDVSTQAAVNALQGQQASMLAQLAVLQGYTGIVAIYNPCGVQTAADEVFLKLTSGKYLASFSDNANGLNTRFSVLYDGTFRTTDASNCNFTVSGNGTIISNEHN